MIYSPDTLRVLLAFDCRPEDVTPCSTNEFALVQLAQDGLLDAQSYSGRRSCGTHYSISAEGRRYIRKLCSLPI